tara:strand:+ start:471 stop:746 length:276 start_codon:yes stop_codon:yes gene_type:complete
MITVWFLLALIAFPGSPAIKYKGYYAYHTEKDCELQRPHLENFIVDMEIKKGNGTLYVETYCLEMEAFSDQLEKYKKEKGIRLDGEQLIDS